MTHSESYDDRSAAINTALMRCANILRGAMPHVDYKDILLPLLIFKRISDTYHDEIAKNELTDLEIPHRYTIPTDCSWHEILSTRYNISEKLESTLIAIETANPQLEGILVDRRSRLLIEDKYLQEVLSTLSQLSLGIFHISHEEMGHIFTAALEVLARNDGKRGSDYLTPSTVSLLLAKLVTQGREEIISVYDPACGSAGLLLAVSEQRFIIKELAGQDINASTLRLARMNMLMHGKNLSLVNLQLGNVLEDPKHLGQRFEVVLSAPPFGTSWEPSRSYSKQMLLHDYGPEPTRSKADFAFVQHMLRQLADDGTMAVVLPLGVLSRGNSEQKIRKYLIQELNCLDTVIGLPPNLFYGTAIPACILIFKKQRQHTDNILFIDASNQYGKERWYNYFRNQDLENILTTATERKSIELYSEVVPLDSIRKNNFDLDIQRYVDEYRKETIHSFVDFHNLVERHLGENVVFRGVKDSRYEITPSIGRLPIDSTRIEHAEEIIFKQFKEQALPHLNFTPRNDWEWLALAQHHGLPTRLLDWTVNPLIALYFAVEEDCNCDSAVYIYVDDQPPVNLELSEYANPLLFPSDQPVLRYTPAHLTPRIIAQSGLFTIHQNVTQGFTSEQIYKIVIPKKIRKKLKQQLYRYGIHRGTIYPGLDGTSAHIKWLSCQTNEE
ncbi:N-6 DNA methylase [Pseudomonas sp. EGD-AK9]|uniref:N-6 DNA methylase n=1 Tax=Pseudomonas sp. EGD-AK9 TaxID=1386078 RepID=UPI0003F77D5C|nr:N-6 DNA methylase [Pseudomonas sp. EGD-AK9]